MPVIGIVCEYNPFHRGHRHQFDLIREKYGESSTIVCLMSGNYVQRGVPAIFDKSVRAKAALLSGADLVLELPVQAALSSAEGFAYLAVKILSECCDVLCFGTESLESADLFQIASVLQEPDFSVLLKEELSRGFSFPAARCSALQRLGIPFDLRNPNDLLGVEYCKAILELHSGLEVFTVRRDGMYHSEEMDTDFPSASAVRKAIVQKCDWESAVPENTIGLYRTAAVHTLESGERAIISQLRRMTEEDFEQLPYGSEGLWRKLMKASRKENRLEDIIASVKSKRYTRTRIDRMILCAFLGLTSVFLKTKPDFVRVLGFTDRGRAVLRSHEGFINAGEAVDETQRRLGDLYGLFCAGGIEPPDAESRQRIFYHREEP